MFLTARNSLPRVHLTRQQQKDSLQQYASSVCSTSGRQEPVTRCVASSACPQHSFGPASAAQFAKDTLAQPSRRDVFLATMGLALALSVPPAQAEDKLPKEYRSLVERLAKGIRESVESEVEGKKEYEVRRAADPAKEAVQDFVRKWANDPRVVGSTSHTEIKEMLAELGAFYRANGARARLSEDVRDSVLAHAAAAEAALSQASQQKPSDGGKSVLGSLF